MDAWEREEENLMEMHANGDLTDAELRHELRELQRDARAAAEEEAELAYEEALGAWGPR